MMLKSISSFQIHLFAKEFTHFLLSSKKKRSEDQNLSVSSFAHSSGSYTGGIHLRGLSS